MSKTEYNMAWNNQKLQIRWRCITPTYQIIKVANTNQTNMTKVTIDEIPVYPQERFAYYKIPFWPVLCLKRIGLRCYTFFTIIVTCSLQVILLSNYLLPTIPVLAEITLLKTTCHFLLLLVGFDTLTYQKELQLIPYTCGSARLFSGAVAGE